MTSLRIGVDLGGTKTEIIALDDHGNVRLRRREPTPRDDYHAILDLVTRLVREAEDACGIAASSARVGIGTPGSISRANGLLRGEWEKKRARAAETHTVCPAGVQINWALGSSWKPVYGL